MTTATGSLCERLNKDVRNRLGISWDLVGLDSPNPDVTESDMETGIRIFRDQFFGPRLCQDGWKVGTSSWCLACCEVVKKYDFEQEKNSKLVVFKIPDSVFQDVEANARELGGTIKALVLPQYWLQPVRSMDSWCTWNWSPVPLSSLDEAEKYLTGWVA